MRDMSQGGVSVRAMSHKCERYESEWSKCAKKRKESVRVRVNCNRWDWCDRCWCWRGCRSFGSIEPGRSVHKIQVINFIPVCYQRSYSLGQL